MKKILSMALLLSVLSCTKESSSKVNSANQSNATSPTAQILCNCAPDTIQYRVWYQLSNATSANSIWLVFSEDNIHVSNLEKLRSDYLHEVVFIRHLSNGINVSVGKGGLYIVKGLKPNKGSVLTGILAGVANINTDCDACPNTPLSPNLPYNTTPIP
jgi:hypothetical protein